MPKAGPDFDPSQYALVADRIRLFFARYPLGRIATDLISRADREIVFRARVYRSEDSRVPAATGWASERVGDGEVNAVACLENTETSAVGRALANLGFTAAAQRPSAEEMAKAARARARLAQPASAGGRPAAVSEPLPAWEPANAGSTGTTGDDVILAVDVQLQQRADRLVHVHSLLDAAVRAGLETAAAESMRATLREPDVAPDTVARLERRLRGWLARHADARMRPEAPPPQ